MQSRVGTPYYVAPEVLTEDYTNKCDVWSVGVIAYTVLCGYLPFDGKEDGETLRLVQAGHLEFPSPDWDDIGEEAKQFVQSMLQKDPRERPSATEALRHPWVAKYYTPLERSKYEQNLYPRVVLKETSGENVSFVRRLLSCLLRTKL